jgi:hypothetical protein
MDNGSMTMQITKPQLGRLQTLYAQLARHEIGVGTDRESRIRWATERLGKPVTSFKDLSGDDAGFLIDSIQTQLGVKVPPRKRLNRDQARRAGLDGRADDSEFADAPQLATSADLARIQSMISQLGWDEAAFNKFKDSSRWPLRGNKTIRTTADANKVWWALKRIAQSKGIWRKRA